MVSGQEHDRLPYVELDEERPDKVQSDIGRSGTERLRDPGDVGPDVLQLGEALIGHDRSFRRPGRPSVRNNNACARPGLW